MTTCYSYDLSVYFLIYFLSLKLLILVLLKSFLWFSYCADGFSTVQLQSGGLQICVYVVVCGFQMELRSSFWTDPNMKHLDQPSQNWWLLVRCKNGLCKVLWHPSHWDIFCTLFCQFSSSGELFLFGYTLQRRLDRRNLCRPWHSAPWSVGGNCYVYCQRDSLDICNCNIVSLYFYDWPIDFYRLFVGPNGMYWIDLQHSRKTSDTIWNSKFKHLNTPATNHSWLMQLCWHKE